MENSKKRDYLGDDKMERRTENKNADTREWRFVSKANDGDTWYVQVRTARGEWGKRLTRASPLKSGGFSKGYRNLIIKGVVPPPAGYRLSTTTFLNNTQEHRLVRVKKQNKNVVKEDKDHKEEFVFPGFDPVKTKKRPLVMQFDMKIYVHAKKRENLQLEALNRGGKRYQRFYLYGQNTVIVADTERLKRRVRANWAEGWSKDDEEQGMTLLRKFVEVLETTPNHTTQTVAQQINNAWSFFDEEDWVFEFDDFVLPVDTNVEPINFLTQRMREDGNVLPQLHSPYILHYDVDGEDVVVYRNIKKTWVKDLCVVNVIRNAYLADEERLRKDRRTGFLNDLTVEGLVKLLFPNNTVEEIQQRGISFEEALPFFKKHNLGVFLYDVYGQVRASWKPEKYNNAVRPQRLNVLYHEKHVYLLNCNVDHLEKVHKPVKVSTEEYKEGASFYKDRQALTEDRITTAWSVEEAVKVAKEIVKKFDEEVEKSKVNGKVPAGVLTELKKKEREEAIKVYVPDILLPSLVVYLRTELNYRVEISLRDTTSIGAVMFRNCTFVSLGALQCGDVDTNVYHNREVLTHVVKVQDKLHKGFFGNPAWRSTYHPSVFEVLKNNKPSQVTANFNYQRCTKYTKYDIVKCYTSVVRDMEWLVSFNAFDVVEEYNGEGVYDWYLYFVKKTTNCTWRYPLKRYNLMFGKTLNESDYLDQVEIMFVLKPSHRVKNTLGEKLRAVFEDKKLLEFEEKGLVEGVRKWLSNTTVGKLGQHVRSAWKGRVFSDKQEACTFAQGETGGVRHFRDSNGNNVEDLFLQYTRQWDVLKDGYMPLHHYVVETAAAKVLELKQDLEVCGYTVYDIKVDCCDVDYNPEAEAEFKRVYGSKWFRETGTEWERLGGLRVEHHDKVLSHQPPVEVKENVAAIPEVEEVKVEEVKVDDEWDTESIHSKAGNVCCIEAVMPGSGKTYVSEKLKGNTLFVCPNNKIVTNLLRKGLDAVTFDTLFQYRLKRHAEGVEFEKSGCVLKEVSVRGTKKKLENYQNITFDELLLLSIDKIFEVSKFVKENCDKYRFYLNYDPFQNKCPDEKLDNVPPSEVRKYKLKICREIAGRYIVLRVMKRNTNTENVKHYETMFGMLLRNDLSGMKDYLLQNCGVVKTVNEIATDFNVAYTNYQCDLINEHVYRTKFGDAALGVGQTLIYTGTSQIVGKSKMRFFKNDEYEITEIKDGKYQLRHSISGSEWVTKTQIKSLFKLPYAWTGHSTQGSTVDKPYTVDLNWMPNSEWLWTAVTRCTNWAQITVFYNEGLERQYANKLRLTISNLVYGYKLQDAKAGRVYDESKYVDTEWVMKRLVSGACCYCGNPFNIGDADQFSVDRIDNDCAHHKDNCQLTCVFCNSVKR